MKEKWFWMFVAVSVVIGMGSGLDVGLYNKRQKLEIKAANAAYKRMSKKERDSLWHAYGRWAYLRGIPSQ